jgi:hypothetical protein
MVLLDKRAKLCCPTSIGKMAQQVQQVSQNLSEEEEGCVR